MMFLHDGRRCFTVMLALAACRAWAAYVAVPDVEHVASARRHTGIPSIAVARNGRLWVTFYGSPTGGEDSNNYCMLATSADGGDTWKDVLVADPDGKGPLRAFDPEIWAAPDGRIFWTWTERVSPLQAESSHANAGCLADPKNDKLMCVEFPGDRDLASPTPQPRQIGRGVMMCKPIVRNDGAWLFPSAHWSDAPSACIYESKDSGKTFACIGGVTLPQKARAYDEHAIVQLRNGDLLAFMRTVRLANCMESVSHDGGRTWEEPKKARINHTSSRLFLRKLKSGNLLLVKHGKIDEDCGRRNLMAFLSRDDGKTWEGGLLLDARDGASYPDGDQAADGLIHVVYDHDRLGTQEILLASFTEDDVLAGKLVSPRSRLRGVVSLRGHGSPVGGTGETVRVPLGAGVRFTPNKCGKVGRMEFVWSDGCKYAKDMSVIGQWNGMYTNSFPDSLLCIGRFTQYVRPLLKHFHSDVEMKPEGKDLLANWDGLPKASRHEYKFGFNSEGSDFTAWSEGSFAGKVPYPGGTAPAGVVPVGVDVHLVSGATWRVTGNTRPRNVRFEILRFDENPRARTFAGESLEDILPGEMTIHGVPMRLAAPCDSQDVGICREIVKLFRLVFNRYRSRQPHEAYPYAIHYRMPPAHYVKAHVVFALDPAQGKDRKFVLRQALHAEKEGTGSNMVFEKVVDLSGGIPSSFEKIGNVTLGEAIVPLYYAAIDMDIGPYIDFAARNDFLEFEFCGTDLDGRTPSAATIFATTLEKLPVVMDIVQSAPGNVFTADEKGKGFGVKLSAKGRFKGEIVWSCGKAGGHVPVDMNAGTSRTVKLDLGLLSDVGLYEVSVALCDPSGRNILVHPARMCVVPPSGRLAERDVKASPYGTWWFNVHGSPGDYSLGFPLLAKAGIRKASWTPLSPEICEKYKIINTGNVKALDQNDKNFDSVTGKFKDRDGKTGEELFVEDLKRQMSAQVWTDHVLIWHENNLGRYFLPEEILDLPVPPATDEDKAAAAYLNECGRIIRKHFPGLKIQVGNSFHSLGPTIRALRGGANPDYYDTVAVEAACKNHIPERLHKWNNQITVMLKESVAAAAHRPVPVNGCWEFIYRTDQVLGEDMQAAFYMRDILISLQHGFTLIAPSGLFDVTNGYYDKFWGSSALLKRVPYTYPKKAYLAYAVLTKCLDAVKFVKRVPTGSTTVYALEFLRADGKTATAFWTVKGEGVLKVDGEGVAYSMCGRATPFGGATGVSSLEFSWQPSYAISDRPLGRMEVASRSFMEEENMRANGAVAVTFDSADTVKVTPVNAQACNQRRALPIYLPSDDFSVSAVDDAEAGRCLEVSLDTSRRKVNKYFTECTRLELAKPVVIPEGANHLGVKVKGNSSWGQIRFEVVDADGVRFDMLHWSVTDCIDRFGTTLLDFDGWGYVYYPFDRGAEWHRCDGKEVPMKFPVKLVAMVVGLNREKLDLSEFSPAEPRIRIKDVFWSAAPFQKYTFDH